ncbi:DUF5994 family protein [Microlunatus ginsengisoli]|uniref:DUF5994 family protein n=1 Tax=Microlunatus ginsengisoli TaxID=363863 RepID=UPI0031CDDA41
MSIAHVVAYSSGPVERSATQLLKSSGSPRAHARGPLRLRLSPDIGRGALDGAWWPYSRDLTVEALDLVDHFPGTSDRICRVVYSTPDWEPPGRGRVKTGNGFVNFGSFPREDTHLVLLKGVTSPRLVQLLVVPPEWGDRTASHAMRIAATPANLKSGPTILSESVDLLLAGVLSHWDGDGGANDQT